MHIFEVQKDSIVRLLKAVKDEGARNFVEHLWIIPVEISKSAVRTHFLARRTTDIVRFNARKTGPPLRSLPGPDLVRPFGNLKLTLGVESVMVRERNSDKPFDDIVWDVRGISRGRAVIALTTPSWVISDLTQLNNEQELGLASILDKLNHGDSRDRIECL
jgi:hypothetical protein